MIKVKVQDNSQALVEVVFGNAKVRVSTGIISDGVKEETEKYNFLALSNIKEGEDVKLKDDATIEDMDSPVFLVFPKGSVNAVNVLITSLMEIKQNMLDAEG